MGVGWDGGSPVYPSHTWQVSTTKPPEAKREGTSGRAVGSGMLWAHLEEQWAPACYGHIWKEEIPAAQESHVITKSTPGKGGVEAGGWEEDPGGTGAELRMQLRW